MGYFPVRYDSRVVIYEHKMFIRLATGQPIGTRAKKLERFVNLKILAVVVVMKKKLSLVRCKQQWHCKNTLSMGCIDAASS